MMMVDEFSIFDEEIVEEAGHDQEIEAYCAKCKADTLHAVTHRDDEEIRRVRCYTCDDVHAFRPPRGEEEVVEGGSSKKRSQKVKPNWEQVIAKHKKDTKPYNVNEIFSEMDVINHPIFGKGFVSELIGYDKIEVTFERDRRILIHNRQKRPLPLPEYSKQNLSNGGLSEQKRAEPVALSEEQDFEELIDLGEDLLLGNSTKLSPKAWAALHAEDDDEEIRELGDVVDEDDHQGEVALTDFDLDEDSDMDDEDGEDESPKKKKGKTGGKDAKKKTPSRNKVVSKEKPTSPKKNSEKTTKNSKSSKKKS